MIECYIFHRGKTTCESPFATPLATDALIRQQHMQTATQSSHSR
jgi:hypothetical protein